MRPEIWNSINAKARTADARSQLFQNKLSTALVAAAKIGNLAYSSQKTIDKEVRKELMGISLNIGKVLCAALGEVSDYRREAMNPFFKKELANLGKNTEPSEFLFGEDLEKEIKSARAAAGLIKNVQQQQRFHPYEPNNNRGTFGAL